MNRDESQMNRWRAIALTDLVESGYKGLAKTILEKDYFIASVDTPDGVAVMACFETFHYSFVAAKDFQVYSNKIFHDLYSDFGFSC